MDLALAKSVDLVALCGDLIDRDNRYFEALGPLERGLRRLAAAGIPVRAVAGNHDFDTLPEFAASAGLDGFRVLGRGGRWEEELVRCRNGEILRLAGWSFPTEHVPDNPLLGFRIAPDPSAPCLGLVHSDLGSAGSRYAPMQISDLARPGLDLWLVGHIHKSAFVADQGAGPAVLTPGSPRPWTRANPAPTASGSRPSRPAGGPPCAASRPPRRATTR